MEWGDLSQLQIDAIREVGNIGAGNAATALSQMLGRAVDMDVPVAGLVSIYEIGNTLGAPEDLASAVLIRVEGDFSCNLIFITSEAEARNLTELLISMDLGDLSEDQQAQMQDSALSESGNMILGAFLNALSMLTGYTLPASVPAVAHDMLGAIMNVVAAMFGVMGDTALLVRTHLHVKDVDQPIEGTVVMVPDPGSLEALLAKLGV
ncbi:MAG: chemotaxis protein CheC [Synergistales bacterium]|nr:chemotaxis protein CheC [Synergistales bacterium]